MRPVSSATRRRAAFGSRSSTVNESRARRAETHARGEATRVGRAPAVRRVERAAIGRRPGDEGEVFLLDPALLERAPQRHERTVRPRQQEASARVAIEPVGEPRGGAPRHVEGPEPAGGADERRRAPPRRLDGEPHRLRHDQAVRVVVEHRGCRFLGSLLGARGRPLDHDLLAPEQLPVDGAGLPADPDPPGTDERPRARQVDRERGRDEPIEPLTGSVARDAHALRSGCRRRAASCGRAAHLHRVLSRAAKGRKASRRIVCCEAARPTARRGAWCTGSSSATRGWSRSRARSGEARPSRSGSRPPRRGRTLLRPSTPPRPEGDSCSDPGIVPTASADTLAAAGGLVGALLDVGLLRLRCSLLGRPPRVGLGALVTSPCLGRSTRIRRWAAPS